jgi:hypothetical protein
MRMGAWSGGGGVSFEKGHLGERVWHRGLKGFLVDWWRLERRKVVVQAFEDQGEMTHGNGEEREASGEEWRERLKALAETANVASLKVLERCDFERVRTFAVESSGDELVEMGMQRPEA